MNRRYAFSLAVWLVCKTALCCVAADKKSPLDKARTELLNLHNKERKKQKLGALSMNDLLTSAAQDYAEFMAESGKFGHNEQGTPEERVKATGYEAAAGGENIAWGLPSAARVFREWMKSEHHRDNVLTADFTEVGFGIATNANGDVYWVANFGAPRKEMQKQPGDAKNTPP